MDCSRLVEVELCVGLKQILQRAFNRCDSLERIYIPSSVEKIGDGAFHSCSRLREVLLCDGLEYIEKEAFMDCNSLVLIHIPSSIICIGEERMVL
jgi:hypothetical protein